MIQFRISQVHKLDRMETGADLYGDSMIDAGNGKKIKVLQVVEDMGLNSGVSSMLMNYYRFISHERVNFDFLVFRDVPMDVRQYCSQCGSAIYQAPPLTGRNVFSGKLEKEIDAILAEHGGEYDIIHGHEPNVAFIFMRLAKKRGIACRVIHSHNSRGADSLAKKMRNFVLHKWGLRYATHYCACSKKAALYLYGTDENVTIINNAIDIDRFRYREDVREMMRSRLGADGRFVIGHVGRFAPQKNHEYLLRVFAGVLKKTPDAVLLLIGGGDGEAAVRAGAEELGLSGNVIFAGVTDQVPAYMQAMDVLVLPSRYEGLPVVCVEAQAAGLPCLVSDRVTREVGLLPDVEYIGIGDADITKWEESLDRIRKRGSAPKREQAAGQVRLAGFDIREEGRKLEEYYCRIVCGD